MAVIRDSARETHEQKLVSPPPLALSYLATFRQEPSSSDRDRGLASLSVAHFKDPFSSPTLCRGVMIPALDPDPE